jgi:hypothetical protein
MQKIIFMLMLSISFVACTKIEVPVTELVIFPIILRAEAVSGEVRNRAGGYATVTGYSNDITKISVVISELVPKSIHAGQIRYGECEEKQTKIFIPLNSIQADEFGVGRSETELPTKKFDANRAKKQPLIILYFQRGQNDPKGNIGDPIVCGDLQYRQ